MEVGSRRDYLTAAGGALLAASALWAPAEASNGKDDDVLYGHGMVWNRDLPGVAGDVKVSFDLRLSLDTGTGFGTADDPVHPDWNIHFAINSTVQEKRPRGETRFRMTGEVIKANNPANVGLPVRILAETSGDTTAIAIALGDQGFAGAGVIVLCAVGELARAMLRILQGF